MAHQLSEDRFKRTCRRRSNSSSPSPPAGFGKRTSAYEYRLSGRGGQGITGMGLTKKNGGARLPVRFSGHGRDHQIMLVTNGGQLIRIPIGGVRFTGRGAQGVTLFRVAAGEEVVSVAWLIEDAEEDEVIEQGGDAVQEEGTHA